MYPAAFKVVVVPKISLWKKKFLCASGAETRFSVTEEYNVKIQLRMRI